MLMVSCRFLFLLIRYTFHPSLCEGRSAQNVGHIICDLLIPPVPVVVDIVAPQVYPDGDVLGLKNALEIPGGVRLLPGALTAADDRFLVAEQLHVGMVLREVGHVIHGGVHVDQLVHVIAKAVGRRVDAAEGQTAAEDVRAAEIQVDCSQRR